MTIKLKTHVDKLLLIPVMLLLTIAIVWWDGAFNHGAMKWDVYGVFKLWLLGVGMSVMLAGVLLLLENCLHTPLLREDALWTDVWGGVRLMGAVIVCALPYHLPVQIIGSDALSHIFAVLVCTCGGWTGLALWSVWLDGAVRRSDT